MSADHQVLVVLADAEIVRYDRTGKFYYESTNSDLRKALKLDEAARFVLLPGASWRRGAPGGSRFDAAVRKLSTRRG